MELAILTRYFVRLPWEFDCSSQVESVAILVG